jgi:hypothetical protein
MHFLVYFFIQYLQSVTNINSFCKWDVGSKITFSAQKMTLNVKIIIVFYHFQSIHRLIVLYATGSNIRFIVRSTFHTIL